MVVICLSTIATVIHERLVLEKIQRVGPVHLTVVERILTSNRIQVNRVCRAVSRLSYLKNTTGIRTVVAIRLGSTPSSILEIIQTTVREDWREGHGGA